MQRSPKRNTRPSYSSGSNSRTTQQRSYSGGAERSQYRTTAHPDARTQSRHPASAQPARTSAGSYRPDTARRPESGNRSYQNYRAGANRARPQQTARRSGGTSFQSILRSFGRKCADIALQTRDFLWKYRRIAIPAGGAIVLTLLIVLIVSLATPNRQHEDVTQVLSATSTPAPTAEATSAPDSEAPVSDGSAESTPVDPAPAIDVAPMPTMVATYQLLKEQNTTDVPLGLVECNRVDDSYFDGTLFVGDSVSKKLESYVSSQRKNNPTLLGNAKFLTMQSFSARNALRDVTETSIHPTFRGQKMKLEDAIATIKPKRVYIMLGMNDVGVSGVENAVKNMLTLLKLIKEKSPDVQIFVQSATPRVSGSRPTTAQLFKYNVYLYEAFKHYKLTDYDIWFVDVAHTMRDAEGKLFESYCSDLDGMALHFSNEGCRAWIDYLYTHALVES